MKRPTGIDSHYMGITRAEALKRMKDTAPFYEFRIGERHVGNLDFRSEYHDFEIVSEYRPTTRDRRNRYAVYARQLTSALH